MGFHVGTGTVDAKLQRRLVAAALQHRFGDQRPDQTGGVAGHRAAAGADGPPNVLGGRLALEEPATVADLRAELRSEFDVEAAVADRDLRAFLDDLEAADLVEIREPSDAA